MSKTLRDTPVDVAVTQYRRMADERAHYAQECERLRSQLADQKCEICGMDVKFHGETCTAGGSETEKCCATCFYGQRRPIYCLCTRNPYIKNWFKPIPQTDHAH